ncbi:hypothetical protein KJ068_09390 [bacterium]|nr:hypothetical protein [bacterium]
MKLKIPDFFKDAIKLSNAIIAFATVVNALVAYFMWGTAQDSVKLTQESLKLTGKSIILTEDIFKASHRPFVGGLARVKADNVEKCIIINIDCKNYGNVPAKKMEVNWEITINGNLQPMTKIPDEPAILFPASTHTFAGQVCENMFSLITDGSSILEITLDIEYEGVSNEKYHTFQKFRYNHLVDRFMDMGGTWD